MHIILAATYSGTLDTYVINASDKLQRCARLTLTGAGTNASWLAYNAAKRLVYSVDETSPGRILTFALATDGTLAQQGESVWSGGDGPVSLAIAGNYLFVAHYTSGTAAALALDRSGLPMAPYPFNLVAFKRQGVGPVASRQDHAYAHQVVCVPGLDSVFVPDLGSDAIHRLQLTPIGLKQVATTATPPGSGPRHVAFYGGHAYLASELANTVSTFLAHPQTGQLTPVGAPIAVAQPQSQYTVAEIAVDPAGGFVYASVRGDAEADHIAILSRDASTGLLTPGPSISTGGRGPRHFSLSLDAQAQYLVVGNQQDESIALFARDAATGMLTQRDLMTHVGQVAYTGFVSVT